MSRKITPAPQVAARAVIQILAATGRRYTLDGLRGKLREFFKTDGNHEVRAVASMTGVELISALLDANEGLARFGLQIDIANGEVSMGTTRIGQPALVDFIARQRTTADTVGFSEAALEVLSCVAFKQPLSQSEIDRWFGADKRGVVHRLRESGMIEEFTGEGGRLMFATTGTFLSRFGLDSLDDLKKAFRPG